MRYVALLRGINVGGHRPIRMADLQTIFYGAGATNVATYIQSGNVVFAHISKTPGPLLETAIKRATKHDVPVLVRTARELASVVAKNPYAHDPDHTHVMFLAAKTKASLIGAPNEAHAFVGRELYLHLPDGMGRSKLGASAGKLGGTVRNWRTITALLAMSQA